MAQQSSVPSVEVPRVAFLGVCDRLTKTRNAFVNLSSLNLIGLRQQVVASIYPLSTQALRIVLAVYNAAEITRFRVAGKSTSSEDSFWFDAEFTHSQDPLDQPDLHLHFVTLNPLWIVVSAAFPEMLITSPDSFQITAELDGQTVPIGVLHFLFVPAPPLTEDRIAAIRSDPRGLKSAKMVIQCRKCGQKIEAYAGLEKSKKLERNGVVWYKDLPDRFTCDCGMSDIDLEMVRDNLHVVLGERRFTQGEAISVTRLYEEGALDAAADKFRGLLDRSPEEAEIQTFLEENPLLFHRFAAEKIIKKPPILNRYAADFGVFSQNGELFLIEIEKPGKRLLKKDGGSSSDFTHAHDQVRDWIDLIQQHRITCLEMMGLENDLVTAVRGVVIMGRDKGYGDYDYDRDHLRKFKGLDRGQISFYTYDDILHGLEGLSSEIRAL